MVEFFSSSMSSSAFVFFSASARLSVDLEALAAEKNQY
jgi:hypothetical protein